MNDGVKNLDGIIKEVESLLGDDWFCVSSVGINEEDLSSIVTPGDLVKRMASNLVEDGRSSQLLIDCQGGTGVQLKARDGEFSLQVIPWFGRPRNCS